MASVTSIDGSVYYKETYWNSLSQVKHYIQYQMTGCKTKDSLHAFQETYAKRPFKHALFLNCGNGWLERWFLNHDIIKKATAFDCSPSLIDEAKRKKGNLPIRYFIGDANTIELPENAYDLVVNSAALHHVQYINRLCVQVAKAMKPNGVFFHYDYIGPHRNQYSLGNWLLVLYINRLLPLSIRKEPLHYAHVPTMLATDPSEAIHSELILKTLSRYFPVIERHDIGGMIAYNILSLNSKVHAKDKNDDIAKIIEYDRDAYASGKTPPLFTYMVTSVDKKVLTQKKLRWWQLQENLRERDAKLIEWTYSPLEFLWLLAKGKRLQRSARLILYLFARAYSHALLLLSYPYFFLG